VGCYVLGAFALTYRLWADPAGQMVAGNPGDINLFSWFMRDIATAVSHGHLPALVTTGLNAPQGISLMWNTSELLPGVVLAPVTLLAGPQTSLNILLTAGFAGSAASLFFVLRRWDVSVVAAAIGGAVYGFSPALITSGIGHFQLQFAVLPPLIIHMLLRLVTGRGHALRTGLYLGLLTSAQVFIGEELLVDTAVAAGVILVVLAVTQPRAALKAVTSRARALGVAAGLGIAAAVALVICGYPLWVQFRGPLHEHGSPWKVPSFHSYLYGFVTPSGSLLFHTSASAFTALHYPEPRPEYLAYVGWPLLIVALVAAVAFWRDPKVRLAALTFAFLESFTLGALTVKFHGFRYPAALLPWHWLQGLPVLAQVLPDRFSILADGAAGALLAFSVDRARRIGSRTEARTGSRAGRGALFGALATAVAVVAVLPLIPRPMPVQAVEQPPAGWQAAFAELGLPSDARVLVIPDLQHGLRWQAETGVPASMVGGGDFIEPNATGQATSYIYNRLSTAVYLTNLWEGKSNGRAPSQAQIRKDLAYWRLSAIVAPTGRNSRLARFLTKEFGPPAVQVGDMLAWRIPSGRPPPGKLSSSTKGIVA
jgi:hypothetical protein